MIYQWIAFACGALVASGVFTVIRIRDARIIAEAQRMAETHLRLCEVRDEIIRSRINRRLFNSALQAAHHTEARQLNVAGHRLRKALGGFDK